MNNLTDLQCKELALSLTSSELIVLNAASKIVIKVFNTNSVIKRMDSVISKTTVYSAIHRLQICGLLNTVTGDSKEMKDKIISISFTEKGRSICKDVKEIVENNKKLISSSQLVLL